MAPDPAPPPHRGTIRLSLGALIASGLLALACTWFELGPNPFGQPRALAGPSPVGISMKHPRRSAAGQARGPVRAARSRRVNSNRARTSIRPTGAGHKPSRPPAVTPSTAPASSTSQPAPTNTAQSQTDSTSSLQVITTTVPQPNLPALPSIPPPSPPPALPLPPPQLPPPPPIVPAAPSLPAGP